ncbi:Mediator of RNA polymerase II transcription subunit 18 [Cercospora zeina]
MREYLLYSQIPAAREEQVLSILAGISRNQPTPINEQILLYAQLKAPAAVVSKKQPQPKTTVTQPLSYHRLIRSFDVDGGTATNVQPWTFRAESIPDTGITTYISRTTTSQLATPDQLSLLKQPQFYHLKRQYIQSGSRFIHHNLIIKVVRFYSNPPETTAATTTPPQAPQDPLSETSPPKNTSQLKLVDASGSFIIEVSIRVEDPTNSSLTEAALGELMRFKSTLDGAIDLIAPDRFLLDTRVKGNPMGVAAGA